jgi:hypothetical protein
VKQPGYFQGAHEMGAVTFGLGDDHLEILVTVATLIREVRERHPEAVELVLKAHRANVVEAFLRGPITRATRLTHMRILRLVTPAKVPPGRVRHLAWRYTHRAPLLDRLRLMEIGIHLLRRIADAIDDRGCALEGQLFEDQLQEGNYRHD